LGRIVPWQSDMPRGARLHCEAWDVPPTGRPMSVARTTVAVMTVGQDVTKLREIAQRIGAAGRGGSVTGELDATALALDTFEALLLVLAIVERLDRRIGLLEYERR
jgi:hypothetical protein